jgi:hypothetical protein
MEGPAIAFLSGALFIEAATFIHLGLERSLLSGGDFVPRTRDEY